MAMQIDRSNVVPVANKTLSEKAIGALLVDAGKIIAQDAERVLRYAKEQGLRFGDAAIALGLVTREEIDRIVALQFGYSYVIPGESPVSTEVVAAYFPFSKQVEAFRALRSQLRQRWFGAGVDRKRLAILSMNRGDGRSYLAANLAVVFSQLGEHTLLVDGDMRNPRQHDIFGLTNSVGLSTVLSDRAGSDALQRVPGFGNLTILPAGPVPPNPQELLTRANFERSLEEWEKHFDVILIDTSAALGAADASVVAALAQGALLVTRTHKTKLPPVKALCEDLTASGISLVGAVINR